MNNPDFVKCLNNNGISIIDRRDTSNNDYKYIDVYSLDNFLGITTAKDDHNMTFACREYLESLGYQNDKSAPEGNRYNYVYRWRMVGEALKNVKEGGSSYDIYDETFISNGNKIPRKDLEIVFTIFKYDYSKADGWLNENDMIKGIEMGDNKYPALISKGIKVHFDDISRTYGGYVKRRSDGRFLYSISALNEKTRWIPREGAVPTNPYWDWQSGRQILRYFDSDFVKDEGHRAFRAVTWLGEKYSWRYMSFEDGEIQDTYNRSACDFDMQDFVFILDDVEPGTGDPVDIIPDKPDEEPEKIKWTIAAEDLGNLDDFDFNDVVFEVCHVAGEKTAEITAKAAGGTLPIYLYYNGKDADGKDQEIEIGGEWHSWFDNGAYSTSQMINTGSGPDNAKGKTVTISVDENFTLADCKSGHYTDFTGNMGNFYLKVERPDGTYSTVEPPVYNEGAFTSPAPQMICIPGEWKWPFERRHITKAYNFFLDWCRDKTKCNDWHDFSNEANVNSEHIYK